MIVWKCDGIAMSLNQLLKYDWGDFAVSMWDCLILRNVQYFPEICTSFLFCSDLLWLWLWYPYSYRWWLCHWAVLRFPLWKWSKFIKTLGTFSAVKVVDISPSTVASNIPLMKKVIRNRSVRTLGHKNNSFETFILLGIITLMYF